MNASPQIRAHGAVGVLDLDHTRYAFRRERSQIPLA
jgi:hypothetical protein